MTTVPAADTLPAAPDATRPQALWRGLILGASVALVVGWVGFGWVGYLNSDDQFYAGAAQAWVEQGTFLGQSHWSLRHVIVLPMAVLFRLFGRSEWALEAPMLAYFAGLLATTFLCTRAVAGFTSGLLAAGLIASIPVVVTGASMVFSDLPEAVMILASLWCFHFAWGRRRGRSSISLFVFTGALAGLGFITRETTVALLAVYGLLFLIGYGGNRLAYVWMGIGFVLIVGLDTLLLAWASGDPLHRFHVTLRGVAGDNPSMVERFATNGMFDRHGVLVAPRWLQAPLMMLVSQTIGPVLWIAAPTTLVLALRPEDTEQRRVVRLFGLLALSWFLILSYALTSLWLVPRYQTVTICALAVPLGIWLAELAAKGRRVLAFSLVASVVVLNFLLLAVSDREPRFAEHALADWVASTEEPVRTDPVTLEGAAWLLDVAGQATRASAAAPTHGGLYFLNPQPRRPLPPDRPMPVPQADWTVVGRYTEARRPATRLIDALGLGSTLPRPLLNKLAPPPRSVTIYRIPASTSPGS